jgi:hypothetical protein
MSATFNCATTSTPPAGWLTTLIDEGLSPRTRNSYLQAVRGFCRWCVQTSRLPVDPTKRISKSAEAVDIRRKRRSLTIADNWDGKSDGTKERFRSLKPSAYREKEGVANGTRTHDLRNHNPAL